MGGRSGSSNMAAGNATLSKVDKAGFTNEGGGVYSLDIEGAGGGQILDVSDSYNYGGTAYEARAWDSDYKAIGEMQVYSSLNAAKAAIKDKVKSSLIKKNTTNKSVASGKYGKAPNMAPVGASLSLGDSGWTYKKVGTDKWRSFYNGKRRSDRTDADIKRVFS